MKNLSEISSQDGQIASEKKSDSKTEIPL